VKVCALLVLLCAPAWAQSAFAPYAERTQFLLTSPGSAGFNGYANPALLTYAEPFSSTFAWSTASARRGPVNQWGLFTAMPHLGFDLLRQEQEGRALTEYRLSLSGGDRKLSVGLGYGWSGGQARFFGRRPHYALGALWRPDRRVSAGAAYTASFSTSAREAAIDLGLRPLGSERLTLFADYARASHKAGGNAYWSAGAELELFPGLRLIGHYFDNRTLSFGLHLSLGHAGLQTQSRFDEERDHAFSTYAVRLGPYERSGVSRLVQPDKRYLELELFRPVRHRRFALFDPGHALIELLAQIERARRDPAIAGMAINASGLRLNPEMAWEVREKLRQFKESGKRVVVYIDYADLRRYHFASIADHLVLDPAGLLVLEGLVAGQTYFKGALEKLGIGFEEWRLYEYKSAFESLSRQDMSPADREQWQALLDDFYQQARGEICTARAISPEDFDRLVNEETLFLPQDALEKGLVDGLGRWDQVEDILQGLEGRPFSLIDLSDYPRPLDRRWGQRPRVAVVYALGLCALDTGLRARSLVEEIAEVCGDSSIAALVVRVDSPGGEMLASDLVAGAMQKCRASKPVVVSQGYVAASGGYQISAQAHAIVAAPSTITGSIGVIGGWFFDQGFKEKLGLATDRVQVGEHADLDFGVYLPLLGLSLPDRNLRDDEKQKMERAIRAAYARFVEQVAQNRRQSPERIEALAQGRVWSGQRALEKGLVDSLGGLDTAIALAREKAGIAPHEPIELVQVPSLPPFDPGFFRLGLPMVETPYQALLEHLYFRLDHNGRPLLLLPVEHLPDYSWERNDLYGR
jgi:protease-4